MITCGFIGFGNMASALCKGALAKKFIYPHHIYFTEKDDEKADIAKVECGITPVDLISLVNNCDVIVFAIKPQSIHALLKHFPTPRHNQCFVSILAGTSMQQFSNILGDIPLCRVMPNTPALLGHGMSALSFNKRVSIEHRQFISQFFNCTGKTIECEESLLDAVTGISGSGPAFFYKIAEAISELGQKEGINSHDALILIAQTMIGAGHMLLDSQKTPAQLIKTVSSPNGTTVAGLEAMKNSTFLDTFKMIINVAIARSKELGQ